jgi:methylthioribose-1-phosphate isomerase
MRTVAIDWTEAGEVKLLDQTLLPGETVFLQINTIEGMVEAIQALRVRGAPLIGVAAAMGLAAAARRALRDGDLQGGPAAVRDWLCRATTTLADARPTAVNLRWAVERAERAAISAMHDATDGEAAVVVIAALRQEAQRVWDEDAEMCRAIGEAGAERIPAKAKILTHCNTGMLATGGIGTAFGVIRVAHQQGKGIEVLACEARPLRQGTRLTAWELQRLKIPSRVIVDSAAATSMAQGRVDLVIVGADRIAANGDVANKIGTYGLALLAKAHNLPFYVAAPRSTIDPSTASGAEIPIEERQASEIVTAAGMAVYNPAFDVTPAELITGIVTDAGVLEPPYEEAIREVLG